MTCGTSLKVLLELMTSSANVKMQQQIVSLDVVQLHKTGYVMVFPCCFSCMYVYIYIYTHTYTNYTCLYTFIHVYICLYIFVYLYIYIYVYTCMFTYIYIHIYIYMFLCVYRYIHICATPGLQRRGSPFPIICCCNSAFHWEDQQRY